MNFLKKGKYTYVKLIISIIISILFSFLIVKKMNGVWDLIVIFALMIEFVLIHLIFHINKIYDFIYKFRFVICFVIGLYSVIMGYNGSSIAEYNKIVQPDYQEQYFNPILGESRSIRSDEWGSTTPIAISQYFDKNGKFTCNNDNLRGTNTNMILLTSAPCFDIVVLAKIYNIGYLFFGPSRGLSFVWTIRIISLILISFEFFMILTKGKKLPSFVGSMLVTFSAAVQWWSFYEILNFGMLALILIDKFMNEKSKDKKIMYSLLFSLCAIGYILVAYPAWQIPFAYVYLMVLIWIIYKNKNTYKINKFDILLMFISIAVVGLIGSRYYLLSKDAINSTLNTVYPGKRFILGGDYAGALSTLFSYVYSFFFSIIDINNPCELSSMLSLFPIPLIMGIVTLINVRKISKDDKLFIVLMLLISIIFTAWIFVPFGNVLAKVTLLYMVPESRIVVPLGLAQIYLLVFILSNIDCRKCFNLNQNLKLFLIVLLNLFVVYIAKKTGPTEIVNGLKLYLCGIINLVFCYLIFCRRDKKSLNLLYILLIIFSIATGLFVNPIQKGISVITEKPISKKIQEIVESDPNALWVGDKNGFIVSNYILANGARVVNSTSIYPNIDFFEKFYGDNYKDYEYIYNRYAYVMFSVSNNNEVDLIQNDLIEIKATPDKLKSLGIKYIVTSDVLENYESNDTKFTKIYDDYGMKIYELVY